MTDNPFKPAQRQQLYARVALTGVSGAGKTYTALMLATNLAERVAAIDTERGRMLEHQGRFQFDHFAPDRFDPRDLTRLLAQAAHAGYGAMVIDSQSHFWMGPGGALEFVDANTKPSGSKFSSGWNEFRPIENAMLDAIMSFPGHVIVTMRVKTAWAVEQNANGKQVPVKLGLKPEQREGIEHEFSIVGEMSRDHTLTISKSTCEDLMDQEITRPGPELAATIRDWCGQGEPSPDAMAIRAQALAATSADELRQLYYQLKERRLYGAAVVDEHDQPIMLGQLIARLGNQLAGAVPEQRQTPAEAVAS